MGGISLLVSNWLTGKIIVDTFGNWRFAIHQLQNHSGYALDLANIFM